MAEEILTLMADLDDESQRIMGGWYEKLREKRMYKDIYDTEERLYCFYSARAI